MGNVEKVIVLTVLFLSAVVLAISLNSGDDSGVDGPIEAARRTAELGAQEAGTRAGAVPVLNVEARTGGARDGQAETGGTGTGGTGTGGTGTGGTGTGGTGTRRTAERIGTDGPVDGTLLISSRGLEPSKMADYRIYTLAEGDTWAVLAERYYGDRSYVPLLRAANEDVDRPVEGGRILVPVRDFREEAGSRERLRPANRPVREPQPVVADGVPVRGSTAQAPITAAAPRPGGVYAIHAGDSLTSISQRAYGTVARWREIYEANRGVLEDPDWLEVGMELKLPN